MEFYGRGNIVKMANTTRRNLNLLGDSALDLRTTKPCGANWDFSIAADRDEARQLVRTKRPTWVIGMPPCTAFCRLMQINYARWTAERIAQTLHEAKTRLHCMIEIYFMQLDARRHFLHEHPRPATSWDDPRVRELLRHPRVRTTVDHQCQYGLMAATTGGGQAPALKPTRFASSPQHMLKRLSAKCDRSHQHQQLTGKKAADAAF